MNFGIFFAETEENSCLNAVKRRNPVRFTLCFEKFAHFAQKLRECHFELSPSSFVSCDESDLTRVPLFLSLTTCSPQACLELKRAEPRSGLSSLFYVVWLKYEWMVVELVGFVVGYSSPIRAYRHQDNRQRRLLHRRYLKVINIIVRVAPDTALRSHTLVVPRRHSCDWRPR